VTGPWRLLNGPAGLLHTYTTSVTPGSPTGPALLLTHDLPRVKDGGNDVGRTFPALADRLAQESGWRVVTGTLRGAGGSEGEFSPQGWMEDMQFLLRQLGPEDEPVWIVGFGLGGALALRLAASHERVRGVACLGTAADLSTWADSPSTLVTTCRWTGVIHERSFPPDEQLWAQEFIDLRPTDAAQALKGRPLLVVQGADDPDVPTDAALALVAAATGPVDLRVVHGAGHWLRADPRVVATLVGWLERQR
jgi:uncharacterized protein